MIHAGVALDAAPCWTLDIGASKVDTALVSADRTIARRERCGVREAAAHLFAEIVSVLELVSSGESMTVLGVGCASPMTRGGERVSPLNIAQWRDFPVRARLREALGIEVFVEGDARALTLAEGVFGGARRDESCLSMVVSTGIGGGLVMDGRLVDRDSGNAGHVGRLNVVPNGGTCTCGSRGCLEAEASGLAIEAVTGRGAREADVSTRRRARQLLGRAVGTLASVLDFNRCYIAVSVVLGFGDDFFARANEAVRAVATMPYSSSFAIWPFGLGGDEPLLGAALVGWRGAS
ncbi:MAG TPA: ROK family protein [Acidimicrobiales bacterium]|nr:ROK family protein [Acidimicrobiales bacterium]